MLSKKYLFAVSNPCFEIWLLLHIKSIDEYTSEQLKELTENRKLNGRTRIEKEIIDICGTYNKSNLNSVDFLPYVETAIERARVMDVNPNHRWTNHIGTRVYLLAESIISHTHR